jgi:hypothetical protein
LEISQRNPSNVSNITIRLPSDMACSYGPGLVKAVASKAALEMESFDDPSLPFVVTLLLLLPGKDGGGGGGDPAAEGKGGGAGGTAVSHNVVVAGKRCSNEEYKNES